MRSAVIVLSALASASGFVAAPSSFGRPQSTTLLKDGESNIETIEFKIFPDGRVEEVVRGVKGVNCNKVTEDINAVLGKVVETAPTEEMFQQAVTVDNEVVINDSDWEGSSSW